MSAEEKRLNKNLKNLNKNLSNKNNNNNKNFIVRLWNYFTTYEKVWYLSILVLSFVFAFVFPEEDVNGVNGTLIMVLYLVDIIANITCELLISKQSRWNFIVSLIVEVTEIATLIILASRFATMAVTIFFWIPIDIISFIVWTRHKDKKEEELTVVRTLNWWQSLLVVLAIAVWTVGIGYLFAAYGPDTDFYDSELIMRVVAYLDACVSAVGIANGLFILFRFREQWIAWYISTFLETAINIISGQWVFLVLKAGYLTNTTYGYIKWTKYIKSHNTELSNKTNEDEGNSDDDKDKTENTDSDNNKMQGNENKDVENKGDKVLENQIQDKQTEDKESKNKKNIEDEKNKNNDNLTKNNNEDKK